jgi:hypothetical protein
MTQGWIDDQQLRRDNAVGQDQCGLSAHAGCFGFRPAFRDNFSELVYLSRYADGRPAPIHVLDGLPDAMVQTRYPSGRVKAVKEGLISGFLRDGCFYTREEAADFIASLALS